MAVHHKVQSTTNVSNSATCVLISNEINSVYWRDSCILCSLQPRYRVSLLSTDNEENLLYTQICSRILFNLEKESCILQHGWNEGHSQDTYRIAFS